MKELLLKTDLITMPVFEVLLAMFSLLTFLTVAFFSIKFIKGENKLIKELIERTLSWWIICLLFVFVLLIDIRVATIGLGLLAFISLRELSSQLKLREADRRTIFWCFLIIPFQFMAAYSQYFYLFVTLIPIIMYIFISYRTVAVGEVENISRSIGVMHWSLMITIFSISHLAYILSIPKIENFHAGSGGMLLFLILITELNDVFQFTCGKLFGKHKIIPNISPNKTVEGFLGGIILSLILGYSIKFLLPINTEKTLILTLLLCVVGFGGDVTMSAIKREHNIKDMGTIIPGHGGFMDRLDSLAFTSITFFYMMRYWLDL